MCLKAYFETLGACAVVVGLAFGVLSVAVAGLVLIVGALWFGRRDHSAYSREVEAHRRERLASLRIRLRRSMEWGRGLRKREGRQRA